MNSISKFEDQGYVIEDSLLPDTRLSIGAESALPIVVFEMRVAY